MNSYKSSLKTFFELVSSLEKLPSIGKKSAQKMAYTLCVENRFLALNIAHAIENAALLVQRCQKCFGLSEGEICDICSNAQRDIGVLCIVAKAQDVLTIEEIGEFGGRYFVLNGEREEIDFELLNQRIHAEHIKEVIFALSPSLANETMMLYIEDKIDANVAFSKIAQGVPTGIGLDSIDQLSLSRAISARVRT